MVVYLVGGCSFGIKLDILIFNSIFYGIIVFLRYVVNSLI